MKIYKAESVVKLAAGNVKLNEKQAGPRMHNLKAIEDGEGVYEILAPIQFKAGEVFGYDGRMPRVIQELVSEPTEEVEEIENMATEELESLEEPEAPKNEEVVEHKVAPKKKSKRKSK